MSVVGVIAAVVGVPELGRLALKSVAGGSGLEEGNGAH